MTVDYPGSVVAEVGDPAFGGNAGIVPSYVPTGLSWKEIEKVLGIDKPMEERVEEAKKLMKEAAIRMGSKPSWSAAPRRLREMFRIFDQEWRKKLNIEIRLSPLQNPVTFPEWRRVILTCCMRGCRPRTAVFPRKRWDFS